MRATDQQHSEWIIIAYTAAQNACGYYRAPQKFTGNRADAARMSRDDAERLIEDLNYVQATKGGWKIYRARPVSLQAPERSENENSAAHDALREQLFDGPWNDYDPHEQAASPVSFSESQNYIRDAPTYAANVHTINMRMTWRQAAQMIAAALEYGTGEGKANARAELFRMAAILDQLEDANSTVGAGCVQAQESRT